MLDIAVYMQAYRQCSLTSAACLAFSSSVNHSCAWATCKLEWMVPHAPTHVTHVCAAVKGKVLWSGR